MRSLQQTTTEHRQLSISAGLVDLSKLRRPFNHSSGTSGAPGGKIRLILTLPETNIAPEYGWLEDEISFWGGLFSRAMLVLGRVSLVFAGISPISWTDRVAISTYIDRIPDTPMTKKMQPNAEKKSQTDLSDRTR